MRLVMPRGAHCLGFVGAVLLLLSTVGAPAAFAQDSAPVAAEALAALNKDAANLRIAVDTLWVLMAGALVFFMNLGFGLLESGLQRQKNCVNILTKNFVVFALSSLAFYVIGFGIMFGDGNSFFGWPGSGAFLVSGADNSPATLDAYEGVYGSLNWAGVPLWAKFFFQLVFAGTAATIVSGAVGERIKFSSYIVFSLVLVAVMYPVTGHWIWGGGFLSSLNFRDFAGSTVVHSVGGWAALAGAIVLGPRMGKYTRDGKARAIPGHSMTSVFMGTLVLWFGWFGFNPGSTMGLGDGTAISHIINTTNLAGAAGAVAAMATAWAILGKPDLTMICNGCLAGLVAITAPCAFVSVGASVIIGLVAGVLVVVSVIFFDRVKIDDPVGATSVHLVNGVWGTLALGLFYNDGIAASVAGAATGLSRGAQFLAQLKGVLAVGIFTFVLSMALWYVLKVALRGIRVSQEEEYEGLDVGEHGLQAYPDFVATQQT